MNIRIDQLFVMLFLFTCVTAVPAAPSHSYLFAGAGQANVDDSDTDFKGTSTIFKIGGGFSITDNISVEAYYLDFGESKDTIGSVKIKATGSGVAATAVSSLSLNDMFDLYAKLGVLSWHTKAEPAGYSSETDSGNDLIYGIGGMYKLSPTIGIRLDYEQSDLDGTDINVISANVIYHLN